MALMVKQLPSPSLFALICSLYFFIFFLLLQKSNAQNATLDPSEARALSSLFQQWNATADPSWNISGEPCSGSALNVTEFNDTIISPAITCNCSYVNNTICHITQLKVHALDRRGNIPKDLTALSYLMVLNIQKNYFTGSLPPFIGNLSALTVFEISHNGFNGTIPKELGNLKELFFLSIGSNNFAGTLPPELGNLVKLKEFYMDSCGVRGEIPSTFANFRNLEVMWAFDNALTGKIPDFIGTSWTKLKKLRFQGNSFEGPIPSSFSKLTSLESLIICDLSNVSSSSLDFIEDLKNLTNLVLRNAFISGSIPSDIGEYQLNLLDLSFNNLTGEISPALFNMSSLNHLFLGNNSLSGILPSRKGEQLQNIDLSYNELSGSFPSWVNQSLNLHNKAAAKRLQQDQAMEFLQVLHDRYSALRSQILLIEPLPIATKMCSLVHQDEKQQELHLSMPPILDAAALIATNKFPNKNSKAGIHPNYCRKGKPRPYCDNCDCEGHTRDTFYKIHGYPSQQLDSSLRQRCDHCARDGHTRVTCYKILGYLPKQPKSSSRHHGKPSAFTTSMTTPSGDNNMVSSPLITQE